MLIEIYIGGLFVCLLSVKVRARDQKKGRSKGWVMRLRERLG